MLGLVVLGSRTWMCTIAAPALAASMEDCAICSGGTGTAGVLPGESAEPVTAQEMITLRCIVAPGEKSMELQSKPCCKPKGGDGAVGASSTSLAWHCALR